ncbi:UNVERIFIED_CONTAM: hypothetical protein HDU68_004105 [Siphonaria sp. JEL0065]|nr:hypothetical protein HDU68_004105 [Siphonaria sp. JEL0065]
MPPNLSTAETQKIEQLTDVTKDVACLFRTHLAGRYESNLNVSITATANGNYVGIAKGGLDAIKDMLKSTGSEVQQASFQDSQAKFDTAAKGFKAVSAAYEKAKRIYDATVAEGADTKKAEKALKAAKGNLVNSSRILSTAKANFEKSVRDLEATNSQFRGLMKGFEDRGLKFDITTLPLRDNYLNRVQVAQTQSLTSCGEELAASQALVDIEAKIRTRVEQENAGLSGEDLEKAVKTALDAEVATLANKSVTVAVEYDVASATVMTKDPCDNCKQCVGCIGMSTTNGVQKYNLYYVDSTTNMEVQLDVQFDDKGTPILSKEGWEKKNRPMPPGVFSKEKKNDTVVEVPFDGSKPMRTIYGTPYKDYPNASVADPVVTAPKFTEKEFDNIQDVYANSPKTNFHLDAVKQVWKFTPTSTPTNDAKVALKQLLSDGILPSTVSVASIDAIKDGNDVSAILGEVDVSDLDSNSVVVQKIEAVQEFSDKYCPLTKKMPDVYSSAEARNQGQASLATQALGIRPNEVVAMTGSAEYKVGPSLNTSVDTTNAPKKETAKFIGDDD